MVDKEGETVNLLVPEHRKGNSAPEYHSEITESTSEANPHNFICTSCCISFRKRDHYDRHRFAHTGVREYCCTEPGCQKEYTNRTHLNRHIRSNHTSKVSSSQNVYRCKHHTCSKSFSNIHNMRRHYEIKHVLGKSWTCSECGENFWRKLQLKQHFFKHTGEYPHKCDICGKGFMNLKTLHSHRRTHALHKCETCTSEFTHWKDLVAHRKLQHATFYHCDVCQRKFPSKKNLKAHHKFHQKKPEDDVQDVFQCPHEGCPKFYDYERNLIAHIRSKHEGSRRYVCTVPECGRYLSTQQKLDQHSKMHESAARTVPRMKQPGKVPAKRKDSGIPKRSTASKLSNVQLEPQVERILIEQSPERRPKLEFECSFSMDSASESEAETLLKVGALVDGQLVHIEEQIKLLREQTGKG